MIGRIAAAAHQAERINLHCRLVVHVSVGINATPQPNRITLNIPPRLRIIIPEIVIVQIRFAVEVLPRKAQIKNKVAGVACLLRILVPQGFAEGSTVPAPDWVAVAVRDDSGGVEMIGVDIKHFCYVAGDGDGYR